MKIILIGLISTFIGVVSELLPSPLRSGLFTLAVFWVIVLALGLLE